jgi:2,3-diketo-5-methylthio-1-phosphopentane phosphatase
MINRQIKIFLDFDGTISKNDVGEAIFRKFLKEDIVNNIVDDLLSERISSRECWEMLCNNIVKIEKVEFDNFILSQEIEPTFHHFVEYCSMNNLELFILSDGFDYYINKILSREKLNHLKFYSNKLELNEDGKLIPSFPFYCDDFKSSSNCKRNHIIENSSDDDYTVFIGDGSSDREAIHYVDFIFAKEELLKYCEMNRISFFPFKNFDDVIVRLDELSSKKRLKKRFQSVLKRREAYLVE